MRTTLKYVLLAILILGASVSVWSQCPPPAEAAVYENRNFRHSSARSVAALRDLIENPTIIESRAEFTDEAGARIETMTETHAVYPTAPDFFMRTLRDNSRLTEFIPNLAAHEIVCRHGPDFSRQRQRTDFGILIFTLGTEYIIDVEHVQTGPDVYSSQWSLVESVDGRLGFLYGSWYFEGVVVNGQTMTYVHHYVRTGLTTRVPGVRAFVRARLEPQILAVFNELYNEAVDRYGRTAPE